MLEYTRGNTGYNTWAVGPKHRRTTAAVVLEPSQAELQPAAVRACVRKDGRTEGRTDGGKNGPKDDRTEQQTEGSQKGH